MKIKQTLLALVISLGCIGFVSSTLTYAATCAGVETSIVACDQKGTCPGGENPYEGVDPKSSKDPSAAAAAYQTKYNHAYGWCVGGVAPTGDVKTTGVWGILILGINILTAGVGILAVGGIIYGSILYTSSGGNPENTKKAMTFITNVVIGIVAYGAMFALLNFVIPGGLFT